MLNAAEERPWLWVVYVLTVALPLILIFVFCCTGKVKHTHSRILTHTLTLFISVFSAKPDFTKCVCPQRSSYSADGQLSLTTLQEEFDDRHLSHSSSSSLRVTAPVCVCVDF